MQKNSGKILFYSLEKGKGIIISSEKKKYRFEVMDWNDFDVMPQQGLAVAFEADADEAKLIIVLKEEVKSDYTQSNTKETSQEKPTEYVNNKNTSHNHSKQAFRYKNSDLTQAEEDTLEQISDYSESIDSIGKNIQLSCSISQTMKQYFSLIKTNIQKRVGYKKIQGRINYLLAKRFISTTYNNLQEIDFGVITPRIKSINDDLQLMDALYKEFENNVKYPTTAFENIFLSNQKEYNYLNKLNKEIQEKLSLLKTKEASIGSLKKLQTEKLEKIAKNNKEEYATKLNELKVLNGTYADIVHMIAKLQEEYTQNNEKLDAFSNSYRSEFFKEFQKEAKYYKKALVEILNAQAYLLDANLWKEAKVSKAILAYFNELTVDVELNAKGYLKYYLNSLDETKSSENTKELFTLYEHLQEVQKDYAIILVASAQDAMDFERALQNSCSEIKVKAFIDEVCAFKWAMLNHVKIVLLEEQLNNMDAKKFLDFYHNAIFSKPKIVLLGTQITLSTKNYAITKRLSAGSSTYTISQTLKDLCQYETN